MPRGIPGLDTKRLKGLCKTCVRRRICPKAHQYLDVDTCGAYKVHSNRKNY